METTFTFLNKKGLHDFRELVKIFKAAFDISSRQQADDNHLIKLLNKKDFIVLIAKQGNQLAGGLTAYILHSYHTARPNVYIYDIAVQQRFRRKGIGQELIARLNAHCSARGMEEIFVQAEAGDAKAISFYKKTGYSNSIRAVHFTYTPDLKGENKKSKQLKKRAAS